MSLLIPGTNSIKDTGYDVANSARFNVGSSDNIQRTYGTPTNAKIFGLSWWVKLGKAWDGSGSQDFWGERADGSNRVFHGINADGTFQYFEKNGGSTTLDIKTNRLFRDNSAWYHFLLLGDSTQGTAANRLKLYINGVQETSFSTESYPSSDYQFRLAVGSSTKYFGRIGLGGSLSTNYYDGYLAEAVFVDGTVTAHTDYGEFDSDSPNIWKPKDVSGLTFGNNGFHLDFEDSSALGNDVSGNDNDFTVNNLTAVDQSTDTCTNNFATLNPLDNYHAGSTLSEGNLKIVTGGYTTNTSTIALASGKWFWEVKVTNSSSEDMIGIRGDQTRSNYDWNESFDFFYNSYGRFYDGSSGSQFVSYGATFTTGDIIGVALDLDSGTNTIQFYKNGSAQGSKNITNVSSTALGFYNIAVGDYTSGAASTFEMNFGSPTFSISSGNADGNGYGNFEYSVPSGYYAVNSKNLAEFG
jgi:hypothetical protein